MEEVARHQLQENTLIPGALDFSTVRGLSREVEQLLTRHRPQTVGQAGRIAGVTPAAIALLLVHLRRFQPLPAESQHIA